MKRWILIIIIFVIAIGTYSVVFRSKGILDQITLSNQLETLKLEIDSLNVSLNLIVSESKKQKTTACIWRLSFEQN
jgi:uncharacterized membrane-anchored protein YhcB (DUF1043 family)